MSRCYTGLAQPSQFGVRSILFFVLGKRLVKQFRESSCVGWARYDAGVKQWKGLIRIKLPKFDDELNCILTNLEVVGIPPLDALRILHSVESLTARHAPLS